jgi:hypothetical protein
MYLRHFASDENAKTIGLFNLRNGKFVRYAPIKNQASRDYFYGEDGTIERILGKIEGEAAPVIKAIIAGKPFSPLLTAQTFPLYVFSLLMKNRTQSSVAHTKESMNEMLQKILSYDEEMKKFSGKYKFDFPAAAQMNIHHALNAIEDALDLKFKVLKNETQIPFITSDNPMCSYNQFLERHKHPGGHYGLLAKGLQLYLPLSSRIAIILYDDWAYKIGDRVSTSISLNQQTDVDKLNALQVIQCGEQLFFNADIAEHYVQNLFRQHGSKRHARNSVVKEASSRIDEDGNERILLHMHGENYLLNLQPSFCTLTKKAKHHVLSDYASQLRDERIRFRQRER